MTRNDWLTVFGTVVIAICAIWLIWSNGEAAPMPTQTARPIVVSELTVVVHVDYPTTQPTASKTPFPTSTANPVIPCGRRVTDGDLCRLVAPSATARATPTRTATPNACSVALVSGQASGLCHWDGDAAETALAASLAWTPTATPTWNAAPPPGMGGTT